MKPSNVPQSKSVSTTATATASVGNSTAVVINSTTLSPAHQAVNKLNDLFRTLFTENIIYGRYDYIGDYAPEPVVFFVRENKQEITTRLYTNRKVLVSLFNAISNTRAVEESYEDGFYFNLTSSNNFQALLETTDSQLKQKITELVQIEKDKMLTFRMQAAPKIPSIYLVYVHETSGEFTWCAKPVKTASHFDQWVDNIVDRTFDYGIELDPEAIKLLKFRVNGFIARDPRLAISAQNPLEDAQMAINAASPLCNHDQFNDKTVLTFRVSAQIFAKIKSANDVLAQRHAAAHTNPMVAAGASVSSTAAGTSSSGAAAASGASQTTTSSNVGISGVTSALSQWSLFAPAASNDNASGAAAAVNFAVQASQLNTSSSSAPVPIASSQDASAVSVTPGH